MRPTDIGQDQVGYLLPDGTRLEAYSEANEFHSFFKTGPVVGFAVGDFDRSWERLRGLGVLPLTDIQEDKGREVGAFPHARWDDRRIDRRNGVPERLRHSLAPLRGRSSCHRLTGR